MRGQFINVATLGIAAKKPYALRKIKPDDITNLNTRAVPQTGDVVLARISKLGQKGHLQDPHGREAELCEGDYVLVTYGNRYATDQYEALVPNDLEPCNLVAIGGIAARIHSQHENMSALQTVITPIGLATNDQGKIINLKDYALKPEPVAETQARPKVIIVWGTGMNAGKTTTSAGIVHSLSRLGKNVGFAKITGTANGGDPNKQLDNGASVAYDFVDFGYSTTYKIPTEEIERILIGAIDQLTHDGCDIAVIEIADGINMPDNKKLLKSSIVQNLTDGTFIAGAESAGSIAAARQLDKHGYMILGISGMFTQAPLAINEAKTELTEAIEEGRISKKQANIPVMDRKTLREETTGMTILAQLDAPAIRQSIDKPAPSHDAS